MPSAEREIVLTNDLDGVHFRVPPPFKTTQQLLRRNLILPEINSPIKEHNSPDRWTSLLFCRWTIFCHRISPVNKEALKGLELFRQTALAHERQLRFAALSGRETYKHEMTKQRLLKSGHMEYFSDLYLNQGRSSSSWKESVARRLIEEGLNVVHIDDDLRSGLCVTRVNDDYPNEERILVYIMRNISNHPRLLRRSGIEIPNNLLFVRSFKEAATDFATKLENKTI